MVGMRVGGGGGGEVMVVKEGKDETVWEEDI